MIYSVLENGQMIEGFFPIGYAFLTQWGARKVVSYHTPKREAVSEPFGV